ncbi:MAG: GyrI-like domain-containing protein [Lentisphaeria bacterium]|nr:GyrI-like domain-containing protein [Lentisphaeria bacterium]
MAAEIVRVYREKLPALRFIGRRYTDGDRVGGTFASCWREWFERRWFAPLEALGTLPENGDAYLGFMHCSKAEGGGFEYWIGMFFPAGTEVPKGYGCVDRPAGEIAVCWIRGDEAGGGLYGEKAAAMCLERIREAGWEAARSPWIFERYCCPRFTMPDGEGKVILDFCVYLEECRPAH